MLGMYSLYLGPLVHGVGESEAADLQLLHVEQEEEDAGDGGQGPPRVSLQQAHRVRLEEHLEGGG